MTRWKYEYCPAKLNLFLQVTDRREDGYHNLISLAGFTRFADRLGICSATEDSITLSGAYAGALEQAGGDSIITQLLHKLRDAGYEIPPLNITLEKHIPLGGGLGGGELGGKDCFPVEEKTVASNNTKNEEPTAQSLMRDTADGTLAGYMYTRVPRQHPTSCKMPDAGSLEATSQGWRAHPTLSPKAKPSNLANRCY